VDDLLFNWRINSQSCDIVTQYKLSQQHWLIKDPQRQQMINGIGPMRLVKNRINYALWEGKRTYKLVDEYDSRTGNIIKGKEETQDGILTFATS